MKVFFIRIFIILSLINCTKEKEMEKEINSTNYVNSMLKYIKHYDYEPVYWIGIEKQAPMEIEVNDVPLFRDYDDSGYGINKPINFLILKSGEQKITYRVFSQEKELFIGFEVYIMDKNKLYKTVKTIKETVKIPSSGIYEGEFTFTAEVPYENKGWNDGQDLTQFDKKELETAVVNFYKKMWNIYNDKSRKDDQFPLIFEREKETAISNYSSKEELEEQLQEYMLPYTNPTYEMLPLENYKMVFYANGKAVALEQTSMLPQLRGFSALGAKYKEDDTTYGDMSQLILYLPKGKNLQDGLQIIR